MPAAYLRSASLVVGPQAGQCDTGSVAVSDRDRAKMASIGRDLAAIETDEEPSPERRAEILAWANAGRTRAGIPPLADEWADPPEEDFYRRARALGMVGTGRRRP